MKNDYWSNEGQDYIENNQHKNICRILENQILLDRRQQLYWSERDKLKLFKITANYMNYNWHSSDKNTWTLATKVKMN